MGHIKTLKILRIIICSGRFLKKPFELIKDLKFKLKVSSSMALVVIATTVTTSINPNIPKL